MNYSFSAGIVIEKVLYLSDNRCNALISTDMSSSVSKMVCRFPGENLDVARLHKKCLLYNDEIVFVPDRSRQVHFYNHTSGEVSGYTIVSTVDSRFVFSDAFIVNDELWILPANEEQPIITMDLSSRVIKERKRLRETLAGRKYNKTQTIWKACVRGDCFYLPVLGENYLVVYDYIRDNMMVIETDIMRIESLFSFQDRLFVCTNDSKVFMWDCDNNTSKEILVRKVTNYEGAFMIVQDGREQLFAVPNVGRGICVFDEERMCFTGLEQLTINDARLDAGFVNYENHGVVDDDLVLFPREGGDLVVLKNGSYERMKLEISDNLFLQGYASRLRNEIVSGIIREGKPYDINDYIGL